MGEAALGQLVRIARGTTYRSALLDQPGPVLLGLASIARNGGFRSDSLRTYGGDSPDRLLVRPGELYASLKDVTQSADLLGSVARVPTDVGLGRLTQDTVRLDIISDAVDPSYLYWCLMAPTYRAFCRNHATGTTNLGLPREDFLGYRINLPTMGEQRAIAATLGALGDKIDSNRRLVALIPALIRATIGEAIANDCMQIPVADLARFVNGGAHTKGATGTGRMVLRIAELNSGPGGSTIYNDLDVPDDQTARLGDILMSWSGSLGVYLWTLGEAIINQHIFKVLPNDGFPPWLVFDRLSAVMPRFQEIAKDKATTMGHIKRGHLESTAVEVPSAEAISRLNAVMYPLWGRLLVDEAESHRLSALRDGLLQGLFSGRIRTRSLSAQQGGIDDN